MKLTKEQKQSLKAPFDILLEPNQTTLVFHELYDMFREVDLKDRQPLVWAILTDIYRQTSSEQRVSFNQFIDLLEANIGNRPSSLRTR